MNYRVVHNNFSALQDVRNVTRTLSEIGQHFQGGARMDALRSAYAACERVHAERSAAAPPPPPGEAVPLDPILERRLFLCLVVNCDEIVDKPTTHSYNSWAKRSQIRDVMIPCVINHINEYIMTSLFTKLQLEQITSDEPTGCLLAENGKSVYPQDFVL